MSARRAHVLIIGVSTRAMAASAHRAGFAVSSCDAFGDLDQPPCLTSLALRRDLGIPFGARAAERATRDIAYDAVAYVATFENHPRVVRDLARGRALWGNPPGVLARVRDPFLLARTLKARGFVTAAVAPEPTRDATAWLVKPRASGGGRRVRPWAAAAPVARGEYLQERLEGVPASIVFAADGERAVTLGISRQLAGERAFGATGFSYCGSILANDDPTLGPAVRDAAAALAMAVTAEFGLVGVNGIDLIVRDGVPIPIEVNPRYSASMELVERAFGDSIFGMHVRACHRELPPAASTGRRSGPAAIGKAIVYARRTVRPASSERWREDGDVADIPRPDEPIGRGAPVCTVFATGAGLVDCRAALEQRAAEIERALYGVSPPIAPEARREGAPEPVWSPAASAS